MRTVRGEKIEGDEMQAIFDMPAVRRFTADTSDRIHRDEAGEGTSSNDLAERITCHAQACDEFRAFLSEWAQAVFSGRVAFDPEIEDLLKREGTQLLRRAKSLAAHGRAIHGMTHDLAELKDFHGSIAALDYLLDNWVTPRLAVGPAPRVILSDSTVKEIRENLGKLTPLPADWPPTDPEQLAVFEQQGRE
jgi:hypothetical protein